MHAIDCNPIVKEIRLSRNFLFTIRWNFTVECEYKPLKDCWKSLAINCASVQDSQPCRVLLAQLTSEFANRQVENFIVCFSSQCAYYKKVTPLWGCLLTLVISSRNKNFLIQRSNCTIKVCLVLYESFVSKTGLKFICLIDFFSTSLLTTYACTHAHCCSLFKLDAKLNLGIDCFM